jgi:hypothetical protein
MQEKGKAGIDLIPDYRKPGRLSILGREFPLPGYAITGRKVSGHRDLTPDINFVPRRERMCNCI